MLVPYLRRLILVPALLLCLGPLASAQATMPAPPSTPTVPTPPKPSPSQGAALAAGKLDLNTASPDQLKALPGVGDAYSKRIIDGRPYTAKNQLVTRGILPSSVYDHIKDQIVAHRPQSQNSSPSPNPNQNQK